MGSPDQLESMVHANKLKGELQINLIRLVLLGIAIPLSVVFAGLELGWQVSLSEGADYLAILCGFVYSVVFLLLLRRGIYSRFMCFLAATLDVVAVSISLYCIRYGGHDCTTASISHSPIFLLYMFFIIASIRRHDPANTLYTGILSGLIYALMVVAMVREGVVSTAFAAPGGGVLVVRPTTEAFKTVILVLAGIAGYFVSRNYYRLFRQWIGVEQELRRHRDHLSELVDLRTRDLRQSLADKDVLLQEVHHRVKNNLQIVMSFLDLQAAQTDNRYVQDCLRGSLDRVRTMALIHEVLYGSPALADVDMEQYARRLGENLLELHGATSRNIALDLRIDPIALNVSQAILCGIVLNELITNALKYAFGDGGGEIILEARQHDATILIEVRDDGVGFQPRDVDGRDGLGLELVRALVTGHLGGEIDFDEGQSGGGVRVSIRFSRAGEKRD